MFIENTSILKTGKQESVVNSHPRFDIPLNIYPSVSQCTQKNLKFCNMAWFQAISLARFSDFPFCSCPCSSHLPFFMVHQMYLHLRACRFPHASHLLQVCRNVSCERGLCRISSIKQYHLPSPLTSLYFPPGTYPHLTRYGFSLFFSFH